MVGPELLLLLFLASGAAQDLPNVRSSPLFQAMVVDVDVRFTRKLNLEEGDFRRIIAHANAYLRSRLAEAGIEVLEPPVDREDWDLRNQGVFSECGLSLEIRGQDNVLYRGRLSLRPGIYLLSKGQRNRPIIWSRQETIAVPESPSGETEFDRAALIRLIDRLLTGLFKEKI